MTPPPPLSSRILIRPMRIADYDGAAALWRVTEMMGLGDGDDFAGIGRYLLRNPEMSSVAVADDQIAGTLLAGHDGRRGWLHHLAVDRAFRRQGIARRLVDASLQQLQLAGIANIRLMIFHENIAGQEFWKKLGWQSSAGSIATMFIDLKREAASDEPR